MSTSASLAPSCDEPLASGCLVGGDHWVLIEHDDGTTDLLVAETGLPADPGDVIDCGGSDEITTRQRLFLASPWSTQAGFSGGAGDLVAWEVRASVLPVTLTVNGTSTVMQQGEVIRFRAPDGRTLRDVGTVTISGAGVADILVTKRTAS